MGTAARRSRCTKALVAPRALCALLAAERRRRAAARAGEGAETPLSLLGAANRRRMARGAPTLLQLLVAAAPDARARGARHARAARVGGTAAARCTTSFLRSPARPLAEGVLSSVNVVSDYILCAKRRIFFRAERAVTCCSLGEH